MLARLWHCSRSPALSPILALYYLGLYSRSTRQQATGLALALQRFKYRSDREVGHILRRLLERQSRTLPRCFDAIVPIPLHASRMLTRGFNQSAWLARGVAKALAKPLIADALLRPHHDPAQASLGGRERRRQIHRMFAVGPARVASKRILLVDDVFTTGTTVRAAAEVLRRSGRARSVAALVLLVADPELSAAARQTPRRGTGEELEE